MKKLLRDLLMVTAVATFISGIAGCGSLPASAPESGASGQPAAESDSGASEQNVVLNLAYQYGLSYAPAVIAQDQRLIETAYHDATGGELTVNWNQMSSGADINTAIASGELDGGFMGLAPAITGVTKGLGYKIFSNLSGQEQGLMTNDESINSLADLVGSDKQIALVNIGSVQHIMLAKALAENGYDPHALDSNIVAMKHPDGMAALESGSVACHLTSSPYIFSEKENQGLKELTEVSEAYTTDYSFIVGIASEELYNNAPEVYEALCSGIKAGMDLIQSEPEKAASITCEFDGNTVEQEMAYLERGTYSPETKKLFEIASFMYENQFLDNDPVSYENLVFDNVTGN